MKEQDQDKDSKKDRSQESNNVRNKIPTVKEERAELRKGQDVETSAGMYTLRSTNAWKEQHQGH